MVDGGDELAQRLELVRRLRLELRVLLALMHPSSNDVARNSDQRPAPHPCDRRR